MPFCSYLLRFLTLLSLGFNLRVRGRFVRARAFPLNAPNKHVFSKRNLSNLYKNKIPTISFGGIAYDGTPPQQLVAGPSYLTAVYVLRRMPLAKVLSIGTNFPTSISKEVRNVRNNNTFPLRIVKYLS